MTNSCQQPAPERQPLQYFVPQQIILLVAHDGQINREELDAFLAVANRIAGQPGLVSRRVLTFTPGQTKDGRPSTFSLIFTTATVIDQTPASLIPPIHRLNDELVQKPVAGLTLQAATPNWLLSCAPEHIGTGGPGAVPVGATTLAGAPTDLLAPDAPWAWTLPDRLPLKLPPAERGRGMDIAILDTAPCLHDLVDAYDTWQAGHPLIRSLLQPGGPLQIEPASYADLVRLAGYKLLDHRYLMADHGLFVAGIIHTLAPQARLHLIEVLNPYGVGDLESIALGLWRLHGRNMPRLLINCSLVVNVPLEKHPHPGLIWPRLFTDPELVRRMGFPLEWICDGLVGEQSQVIAAAGNDSKDHDLPARFPAAFGSVVGVGALQVDVQPASYSNLSDNPVPNSIATFGGGATNGLAVERQSVLGVFTAPLPGSAPGTTVPNVNGWAWWAGTSFATPVITGALAALMSGGMSAQAALAAIQSLDSSRAPTGAGEGIFAVHQGP